MANKKPVPRPMAKAKAAQAPALPPATPVFPFTYKTKLIILAVLSFVMYADTLYNTYCLDDGIVIEKNRYVQQGFSGIGKIMTTDAYDSYYKEMNAGQQLSGGRYRPLSEVIFAIEHTLFGESKDNPIPFWRHLISVLFFVVAVIAIFYFLSKYLLFKFRYGEDIAFFATVLFAIHPIHTEVVANVKSLDEILSILFICLTFIFSLRYNDFKEPKDLIFALISCFLALLAKEYAVIMIIMMPMAFYLMRKKSIPDSIYACVPYAGVFFIYFLLRGHAVGFTGHIYTNEILDNPYLLASKTQKLGTEYFVLLKYLGLLIYPYPLVSDYSYNQIPYENLFSLPVIFTLLLYAGIVVWGIYLLIKKNVLAIAVFFYLFNLIIVSNLVMDIGATMGERLIFHSSLGFVIIVSYGLFALVKKWDLQKQRSLVFGLTGALVIVFGYQTMARNLQWKSDVTLFIHDVKTGPNSIMLNGNAGARYIELADTCKNMANKRVLLDSAIRLLRKSIYLHKRSAYVSSYVNMGDAYFQLQMPDSAEVYWNEVRKAYPSYPDLANYFFLLGRQYLSVGSDMGQKLHNYHAAVKEMYRGIKVSPNDAELWYNLGGAYFTMGRLDSAIYAWNQTLKIDPKHAEAKKGLASITITKKDK